MPKWKIALLFLIVVSAIGLTAWFYTEFFAAMRAAAHCS